MNWGRSCHCDIRRISPLETRYEPVPLAHEPARLQIPYLECGNRATWDVKHNLKGQSAWQTAAAVLASSRTCIESARWDDQRWNHALRVACDVNRDLGRTVGHTHGGQKGENRVEVDFDTATHHCSIAHY